MNEMLMNTVEEAESGLRKPGRSGWNEADSYIYTIAKTEEGSIEIPQFGTKHSLNVSVTAGLVIWDFFKQLGI